MNFTLFCKLLRDVRWPLLGVGLLLFVYQVLWAKITQRITEEILPKLTAYIPLHLIKGIVFEGPGKISQALIGGDTLRFDQPMDMMSIAYVHPVTQTIFCIWAIGRAAGALAGEIDRGTMELLLAQPIRRRQIILSHLAVDLVTIPLLCGCLILGTWAGTKGVGLNEVEVSRFAASLVNAAALMFAVSGYTMAFSAVGRFRWRVMILALAVTLVQFLFNFLGTLWDVLEPWRPLTVFYYYQPQAIILHQRWTVAIKADLAGQEFAWQVNTIAVLLAVGIAGYLFALWRFSRRDLPAPL